MAFQFVLFKQFRKVHIKETTPMKQILWLLAIWVLWFLPSSLWAYPLPVPDTGQTKRYNNTEEITCPQPGEAFCGCQDHLQRDVRLTKIMPA